MISDQSLLLSTTVLNDVIKKTKNLKDRYIHMLQKVRKQVKNG